jgi:F0F1-type ATP synthase assembly protein I
MAPAGKRESSEGEKLDSRSAMAVGVGWASKVSTIALSFSLPPVIGFGIDRWSGWSPVATLAGVVLGFVMGLMQILQLSREISGPRARPTRSGSDATERGPDRTTGGRDRPGPTKDGA